MTDLENKILKELETRPGQKARHLAASLGVEKRIVNSLLYGKLRDRLYQDEEYRWYIKDSLEMNKLKKENYKSLNTSLARLCAYYLECLSYDDLGGISEFASSIYGQPTYIELTSLPMFDNANPFDTEEGKQLLKRVRRDRNRQVIFLGYPILLNFLKSRKSSWEGFKVEPIFIFQYQMTEFSTPTLTDDLPQINFSALRSLSTAGETNLMEEAIQLIEELGLWKIGTEQPDLDELFVRLKEIRPEWCWQEEINPLALSRGLPLSQLKIPGIYNRAILITAERSPYTRGLETELAMLRSIEEETYRETSLGMWLAGQTIESPPADQHVLLEVLPLNSEQRQAVRQALSNPLTVITGPPGTGKSQVVASILINAAWQGKTVLFASKNNKAVDIVQTRVNSLGPRPVLLRLGGANEFQSQLSDYLISFLAATSTKEDNDRYNEYMSRHMELLRQSEVLDNSIQELIDLRNEVDALELRVEKARREIGDDLFARSKFMNKEELVKLNSVLLEAIHQADRTRQSGFKKLLWPFIRKTRFNRLRSVIDSMQKIALKIELPIPEMEVADTTIKEWINFSSKLTKRVSQIIEAKEYFTKLEKLSNCKTLEELTLLRKKLTEELSENSIELWQAWLQLQPARLTPAQRKIIGDYISLLQMFIISNEHDNRLGQNVLRRYYQIFPQIISILPCWAVTSLSAHRRIPFEPNYFDLLVIDEASQCDIASALPLLLRARRVVVIGDPMQLRHISTLSKQQDQQLLSKYELSDSYIGWAYSTRSLFDLASSLCRSEDIIDLRDHHRSHADIINFSNEAFYEGRLRIATRYDRLCRPRTDEPAVRWIHVQGKVIRPNTGGAVNENEALCVIDELKRLLIQGYKGSVGVVSPFRAQANLIRDLVSRDENLSSCLANLDFLVDTVHRFQGDERDFMIFSPVVSSGIPETALGFLRSNPNLFNVAVTRARASLVVVGDKVAAINSGVDYLARFASYVENLNRSYLPDLTETCIDFGPEYPTVARPELVSEWERLFYRVAYNAGLKLIPQYPVDKYLLDFALIMDGRRLNIEIDGERYHRKWDGELCRRDQIRNQRLIELGWDVMRFWVYQIRDDLEQCIERVIRWTNYKK